MFITFTLRGLKAGQLLWSAEAAVVYTALGMGTLVMLAGLWMPARQR